MNGKSVVEACQFGNDRLLSAIAFNIPGRNERRISTGDSVGHLPFDLAGDFARREYEPPVTGTGSGRQPVFWKGHLIATQFAAMQQI